MPTPPSESLTPLGVTLLNVGALEAAAAIYPRYIVVSSVSPEILERLRAAYGGTITGRRLILRGRRSRKRLLTDWSKYTRDREMEILRALVALSDV